MGDVKSINEPTAPSTPDPMQSINEPPGSDIGRPAAPEAPQPEPKEPLPSDAELASMTRAELDALASDYGLDSSAAGTKADVIAMLHQYVDG